MIQRVGVLVLGGSVAAAGLVTQLRTDGYEGAITVVDRDPDMPYDRPPLSKDFITGAGDRPDAPWWSTSCDHVLGDVVAVDRRGPSASVRLGDGQFVELVAIHLVVATGSEPVRLPGQPAGVDSVRTAADARALRPHARPGSRVVILGAGTVGTELASTLAQSGAQVTVVDLATRPLDRFLAGHLGEEAAAWIRAAGVDLRLGTRVEGISGGPGSWSVRTDRGDLDADVVVSAVGTRPALQFLEGSGLLVEDGLRCDRDGQALGQDGLAVTGVHGIGDAASWATREGSRRREDWTSAQRQGHHVARRIQGLAPLPEHGQEHEYFWSQQFGRRIQVLGTPDRSADLVQHVDDPSRNAAFYTLERDGQPVAWIAINRPREFAQAMMRAAAVPA